MSGTVYRKYVDYGPKGVHPEILHGEFDPTNICKAPASLDEQIENVWSHLLKKRPRLYNGQVLNLTGIADNYTLEFGHVPFRLHYISWLALRNISVARKIELTTNHRKFLKRHLHAISSHLAIRSENQILLGKKQTEGGYWIDTPGSGYLDTEQDITCTQEIKSFNQIIRREIKEEVNISRQINTIDCFGVFSEITDGIAMNPAILSVADINVSPSKIISQAKKAEDSWEFEELFSIPLSDESAIRSIIVGDYIQSNVTTHLERPESGISEVAPKTPLLLALIGRQEYGRDWFQSIREEYDLEVIDGTITTE